MAVSILLAIGCNNEEISSRTILPTDCSLKAGDVVFRRGSGLTSRAVIMSSKDGVYSHVGIVVDSDSGLMIVHAVPGEPDFDGDEDRVKLDRPEHFFARIRAENGEVRRHSDSIAARKASEVAMKVYQRHTLFDHDYDDNDTTKMYCTQLVTYAFDRAGYPFTDIEHENINFLTLHTSCILPSSLLNSKHLHLVKRF